MSLIPVSTKRPVWRHRLRMSPAIVGASGLLLLAGCTGTGTAANSTAGPAIPSSNAAAVGGQDQFGTEYENTGTGPMVAPTIPTTPSVSTYFGQLMCTNAQQPDPQQPAPGGCTRVFTLTAVQFVQQIANFPMKTATVWGYQGEGLPAPSTPGPTLISYGGERVQIRETNKLPEPSTIHVHGLHQPNDADGVAGISQPTPIAVDQTFSYPAFVPGHVGTFSYHSHFDGAVQEQRGLDGMWDVLPRQEHQSVKADVDVNMTLQIFGWEKEGSLVQPFGTGVAKQFPFDTINGKTGDASGGPITIKKGDRVRIRIYNASQQTHAMHLHGHDEVVVSKNGHAVPQVRETIQTVNPGDFYELEFTANNPGSWIFHCHFPHHTANGMNSGYNGAPVGMTRIFHYQGAPDVPPQYFSDAHYMSKTLN